MEGEPTQRVPLIDLGADGDAPLAYPDAAPFLVREPALARLRAAFSRARAGQLAFVALEGPAGSGKSHLLAELGRAVAATCPEARSFAASAARDAHLAPFVRILGARFGLGAGTAADEAQARIAAVVAELIPAPRQVEVAHLIAHLLGVGHAASWIVEPLADSPQQLEARAFLALKRFLAADAARSPLVLAIDDVDQAGGETVRLLHYLAAGLAGARVMLVATGRPSAALAPASDEEIPVERVALEPLAPEEAERLLGELLGAGGAPPARIVELARRIGHQPRTVVDLVRWLVETGALAPVGAAGSFALDETRLGSPPLPGSPEELTAARLALLPPAERDVLEKAAACGERFWLDALVALYRAEALVDGDPDGPTLGQIAAAGDRTRTQVARLLGRLAQRGWIVDEDSTPGGRELRFDHLPLRELVAARMSPETARMNHLRVAQWLELRPDGRDEDAQEEIGRHLEQAGEGDAAADCYRRAADAARARFFHTKAIRLYGRALAAASRDNLAARIHLWHDLGSVYEQKGELDAALGAFERMLRLTWVASSRAKAAVAFNKLGRVWRRKGNLKLAIDYLERGLGLFEQAADARGVAGSLDDIGQVLFLLGRYDEAHAQIAAALERRGQGGDRRSIAHSLSNLGNVQKHRGHLDDAESCHRQALELRQQIGDRAGVAASRGNLAALALARGDLEGARKALEAALADAERTGALLLQAALLVQLGELALAELPAAGRADEARRRLGDALALAGELGDRRIDSDAARALALVEIDAGHEARALELAGRALALAEEAGLREPAGRALLALAEIRAATLHDDSDGAGASRAAAAELYARGVAAFRELGNPLELARGLERFARFTLETGDAGGGRAMLEEARTLARAFGFQLSPASQKLLAAGSDPSPHLEGR